MKTILHLKLFGLVAILTVTLVFIGVNFIEGQMATQDKPDKPPGKVTKEWIQFTGDLSGGQEVEGCCPNAGPFPDYTMTLTRQIGTIPADTYEGKLFLNVYGHGRPSERQYMVQFGTGDCYIAFKIIGGTIDFDKSTRTTTVTFTDVLCVDWCTNQVIDTLTFTLVRQPI
jgi:hypothetical protein